VSPQHQGQLSKRLSAAHNFDPATAQRIDQPQQQEQEQQKEATSPEKAALLSSFLLLFPLKPAPTINNIAFCNKIIAGSCNITQYFYSQSIMQVPPTHTTFLTPS